MPKVKAKQELTQSVSEVLGGDPRLSEIDEEIALTNAELQASLALDGCVMHL